MSDNHAPGGFPQIDTWRRTGAPDPGGGEAYGPMIEALRDFLDKIAAAKPDEATEKRLTDDLGAWSRTLQGFAVDEAHQVFAQRHDLPGRGQTMSPRLIVQDGDANSVRGLATFGRYFLGGGGAAHGGAIPLLFDEVFGRLANSGNRPRARTAYLHVDYRSITPIEVELQVSGRIVSEVGRKRLIRGELRHGEVLCAEAEGLFVQLLPGQP